MRKSEKSWNETLVKRDVLDLFKFIRCVFKSVTENMCFLRNITVYALRDRTVPVCQLSRFPREYPVLYPSQHIISQRYIRASEVHKGSKLTHTVNVMYNNVMCLTAVQCFCLI